MTRLREILCLIDLKAETSPLSSIDIETRCKIVKELSDLDYSKLKDLRQRAKSRWALEVDENSRFFHGKFHENNLSRPTFTSNLFKQLSVEECSLLDLPFSTQEIKEAVWSCGGDKAPGPDGFSFKLLKKHWDIFSFDIISYVKEFETKAFIPRGCNSSFITLVPKIKDPLSINEFRPISLIGCQYKIISKILANRLSKVIASVVSEVQMAFIKSRQIIDGPLIVDEIISWAKTQQKKKFFLKVDFEKAFDSLNWSFLDSVMSQMGFSKRWRKWIKACLKSAYASVLINEKGLR
ncbi:RNA-directed DNA polymerase, eukaryota [Tanacetum coccineum]